MKKNTEVCRAVAVVDAEPVKQEVLPPLGEVEEPGCSKPAERINFHIEMGQHHGRLAIAHLIIAGWELAQQKAVLGYGGWADWCKRELSISKDTADRYVTFFNRAVGEKRTKQQIPVSKRPTNKELDAATIGMEGKSATRAMVDLGIIKRTKWGGEREGAGRKPKNEAAEEAAALDAVANDPALLIAVIREPISTVYKAWRERDVFARIDLEDLAVVTASLNELASAATSALKARSK